MEQYERDLLVAGVRDLVKSTDKPFHNGEGDVQDWYNYANTMKNCIASFSSTCVVLVESSDKERKKNTEEIKMESESDFLDKNTQ